MKTLILAAAVLASIVATGVSAQAADLNGKAFFDGVTSRTGS